MDANWRPTQGSDPAAVAAGVDPNAPAPAGGDWRAQLQPEARSRIVNKIMETLKKHLPVSVPEGLNELQKIAVRFEEKIYTAATNQSDYLRKISLKMLSMETKTQQAPGNAQVIPNQNNPGSGAMDGYYVNLMFEGNSEVDWDDHNDLASPLEVQHSPVEEVPPAVRPNQKRSKNFSEKEDEMLVSAWLNISMDPVQGNEQSRSTYWKRIYDYFHSNKDFTSDRTQGSLMHRWSAIQENVNKFNGCLSRIEGRRQSGVSSQDKIMQACTLFKSEDKKNKSFQLMHCWHLLRFQQKWIGRSSQMSSEGTSQKKQKATANSSPDSSTPVTLDDSEATTSEYDVSRRPMGRKKEK